MNQSLNINSAKNFNIGGIMVFISTLLGIYLLSYFLIYLFEKDLSKDKKIDITLFIVSVFSSVAIFIRHYGYSLDFLFGTYVCILPNAMGLIPLVGVTLAVTVIDSIKKYIYDWMLVIGILIQLAIHFMLPKIYFYSNLGAKFLPKLIPSVPMLEGAILGLILYGAIYFIVKLIYKKEVFGLGDVFMLAYVGLHFSPFETLIIAIMSFFVAGLIILITSLLRKGLSVTDTIPYAPAIFVSTIIMIGWGTQIVPFIAKIYGF